MKDVELKKDEKFKQNQSLFELEMEEKKLNTEISGCKSQSRNLHEKTKALNLKILHQRENLYDSDWRIQLLERKVIIRLKMIPCKIEGY